MSLLLGNVISSSKYRGENSNLYFIRRIEVNWVGNDLKLCTFTKLFFVD